MARDITRCKGMIAHAKDKGMLLSIGHQRHYSTLYAQALELIENGILGDIKHIRALWHRNNSWPYDPRAFNKDKFAEEYGIPAYVDSWWKEVPKEDAAALSPAKLAELGFGDPNKYGFKDVAELVRWRCSEKTGGGLMAELGSHQLDASSIILGHVKPLAVMGVGGKFFYGRGTDPSHGNDRESDDGVFVTFEFPGPQHPKAQQGRQGRERRGGRHLHLVQHERVRGVRRVGDGQQGDDVPGEGIRRVPVAGEGQEQEGRHRRAGHEDHRERGGRRQAGDGVREHLGRRRGERRPTKSATTGAPAWDSAVRGYRTEMEHFAYCLREWQKRGGKVDYTKNDKGELVNKDIIPRCHGEVAMADAIIALTANMAMASRKRIDFEDAWFDADKPDVPETKHAKKL